MHKRYGFLTLAVCMAVAAGCKTFENDSSIKDDTAAADAGSPGDGSDPMVDPSTLVPADSPAANTPLPNVSTPDQAWQVVMQGMQAVWGYTGKTVCSNARAALQSGRAMTAECTDFCDTFQPQNLALKAALYAGYSSYITWLPVNLQQQIGTAILQVLGKTSDTSPAQAGALACATVVLSAAVNELLDTQRCNAGSNCLPCDATRVARAGCRWYETGRTCALSMGAKLPTSWLEAAGHYTCSGGMFAQREIFRNTCRGACENSLAAAAPIATPVNNTVRCCRCDRSKWQPGWVYDTQMSADYYWSPVSDYAGPVAECEGKSETKTYIALTPYYYYYEGCSKVTVAANSCPQDNSYHSVLPSN